MKKLLQGLMVALLSFTASLLLVHIICRPYVEQYNRETALKQDLSEMRKSIDLYVADQSKLPQSLNDLVEQGYIREIPVDPMTGKQDWDVKFEENTGLTNGHYGVVEVHSSCSGKSADGTAFHDF
jgi:general secretion pathway protein G